MGAPDFEKTFLEESLALDRQSIEKRDFPIGRRGYDPEAVDAHLAMLADELETIKRSAGRQRGDTLASSAAEQVRMIVDAAEQSAADIEREAELEARQIRQDAREAAEAQRNEASTQAREHIQQISDATATMMERIDAMEGELRGLLENLRTGANRVSADLALLQGAVGDLRGATGGGFEPDPDARAADRIAVPAADPGAAAEPAVAQPEPAGAVDEPVEAPGGERPDDEEGARLIALNMALNGTSREETERYIAEHFDLADPKALLDDVYARAGQ